MQKILERVPESSKIHFVWTNELLKRPYFTKKNDFKDIQSSHHKLHSCVFVALDQKFGLQEMPGLESSNQPECAVIFLLMNAK
jgi:hypothetical protein